MGKQLNQQCGTHSIANIRRGSVDLSCMLAPAEPLVEDSACNDATSESAASPPESGQNGGSKRRRSMAESMAEAPVPQLADKQNQLMAKNSTIWEQHCPKICQPADDSIKKEVSAMLDQQWPQHRNSSLLDTWKIRDELMRSIGPAMVLVDPSDVERLGRIPQYSEQCFITMTEAFARAQAKGKRFFIEFFSHRWPNMNEPDDEYNSQAQALVQWSLFRKANGLDVYYWIDYSCMDQQDVWPGVQMLPLYVASSNNILCYTSPDYEERAWCRLERMLFAAFCAPNQDVIGRGFQYSENQIRVEELYTIQDPENGILSVPEDMPRMAELKTLAEVHWGKCWKEGLYDIVKDQMNSIESLVYGRTQVRCTIYVNPMVQEGKRTRNDPRASMCLSASALDSIKALSQAKMSDYINTTKRLIAAALHSKWAEGRRQVDGTLEPRIKLVDGVEYDIANLPFEKLPPKFQEANLQAARHALCHIEQTHSQGAEVASDDWLELAAAEQHADWMNQNSWCTDPNLMCPYNQLAEAEKQKDRDVVRIARREYTTSLFNVFEDSIFRQMDFD